MRVLTSAAYCDWMLAEVYEHMREQASELEMSANSWARARDKATNESLLRSSHSLFHCVCVQHAAMRSRYTTKTKRMVYKAELTFVSVRGAKYALLNTKVDDWRVFLSAHECNCTRAYVYLYVERAVCMPCHLALAFRAAAAAAAAFVKLCERNANAHTVMSPNWPQSRSRSCVVEQFASDCRVKRTC